MKYRQGFVSNSSSSSWVVLFPENILDTLDFEKIKEDYLNSSGYDEDGFEKQYGVKPTPDIFKKQTELFLEKGTCWDNHWDDLDINSDPLMEIIYGMFPDEYTIANFDTGPDEGQVVIANRDECLKILNKE